MNAPFETRRRVLGWLAAAAAAPAPGWAAGALAGNSVYQLRAKLQDQDGQVFEWSSLSGAPVVVSMFYSGCDMVCPMLIETVQATLKALAAPRRRQLRVLLVSFDPARDTVPVLKKTAQQRGCDSQWTLARCSDPDARNIAAVLGVQYRLLPSGEYNHSTVIQVLDPQGRIVAKTGKLGTVDPTVVETLQRLSGGMG
jgi:protein SCO1/2